MATVTQTLQSADIEYHRHGQRAMTMRLFRPEGPGPFGLVIDLHGGAWNNGSIEECAARDRELAEAGIAAAALDFRHAGDGYPTSLVDINYAVRWAKAHANDLAIDPARIALVGQSSGGHLAMLAAMRPGDPRYAAIALGRGVPAGIDASVRCVGMLWPVINPLSRYRHALRARAQATPAAWVSDIPERHDTYWRTEAAMAEGNPVLALERGEAVDTPPAIWIQGQPDIVHDYRDPEAPVALNEPERFAGAYRKAGGTIDIVHIDQALKATPAATAPLLPFLARHLAK